MTDKTPKCPKCGHKMLEITSDPIFRKIEYFCPVCKMKKISEDQKHKIIYSSKEKMIMEEIQKHFDPKVSLKTNHQIFNRKSKIKLSYSKYEKNINEQVKKLEEKIRKK
ncbi:MAG: hypothetical protein GF329_01535 [Candidatus Lokiarchaeota archaeon]|nr:hypothetical protein [Candidatus Lokiarchaeota archaeon]